MAIVSVSLKDADLENLDRLVEAYGLNGRSAGVKTAVHIAVSNLKDMKHIEGIVEGVLIVVRKDHSDTWLNFVQASHEGIVSTQLHSHLKNGKCLEVMILSGDADEIKKMLFEIETSSKADYVRFITN